MFFPEALLNSPMFGIGLTIIVYVFCELIVNRFELNIIPLSYWPALLLWASIYFQVTSYNFMNNTLPEQTS